MKNIFSLFLFALLFVACDGDSSTSAVNSNDEENTSKYSDSSVKYSAGVASPTSSSGKAAGTIEVAVGSKTVDVTVGSMTDHRDGQTYKTVTIVSQTWMAENLNYETANSYCYNDNAANCTKYGRLYTWAAAMDSAGIWSTNGKSCGYNKRCSPTYPVRGVCPQGWHLPTQTEWNTLFNAVGGSSVAGTKLKSTSGWYNSGNGADAFSFSALPAGYRSYRYYYSEGDYAYFWSSSEYNSGYADYMGLDYDDDSAYLYGCFDKNLGFSVRCLQDYPESSSSSVKSSSSSVVIPGSTGNLTDSRDGHTYKTVTIGSQTWMAENLNYESANSYELRNRIIADSYCYNDNAANCTKYGRLYTWAAALDSAGIWSTNGKGCSYGSTCSPTGTIRGVCPEGWHLPSKAEWETLFNAVGGYTVAGTKLKSTSGWYNSGNGTEAFSFSALPASNRYFTGTYGGVGRNAYFWSSTEYNSGSAYYMGLDYRYDYADLNYDNKGLGFSVRCLQDYPESSSSTVKSSSSTVVKSSSSTAKPSSSSNRHSGLDSESSSSSVKSSSSSVVIPGSTGNLTDSRDGHTYKTVTIGSQTWMAENLNYETANSYCYNDNASNCAKYGRLYTWAAAMDSAGTWSTNGKGCGYNKTCSPTYPVRGVCPQGWHLPSKAEWETLFNAVGGSSVAGTKLKSTSGWYNSGNGTGAFSFSALPAGGRNNYGGYDFEGYYAYFWSSTENDSSNAYSMYLDYDVDDAYLDYDYKYDGFSVRCLQD